MESSKSILTLALMIATLASAQPMANSSSTRAFTDSAGSDHYCNATWFFWEHGCKCGPGSLASRPVVRCNQTTGRVLMDIEWCMSYNNTTSSTTLGRCPFSCPKTSPSKGYILLPKLVTELNSAVCGESNREGLLCSKCKPGHGPAVLSYEYQCALCSDGYSGWFLYLLFALLPTTVFLVIIIVCQVRTTSAPLNLFICACQLTSATIALYPHQIQSPTEQTKIPLYSIVTFYTVWNLDFFRLLVPLFCISQNLSNLQVLCMDYIIALFPFLLTIVMYICIQQHSRGCRILKYLWKPFGYCLTPLSNRFNWNPLESTVLIFASFLLLSSTKILFVSVSLLQTAIVESRSSDGAHFVKSKVLYHDPLVVPFSNEHLPYAILSILASIIFVIVPCLLLVLYPTRLFQKCLNRCGIRWHAIHAFADAFNGCYKDGTNGTRDYRSFAGLYLFVRIYYLSTNYIRWSHRDMMLQVSSIALLFGFSIASPYKSRLFNFLDSFGIAILACIAGCHSKSPNTFTTIGTMYVLLYFVTLVFCTIALKLNCQCFHKLKALLDRLNGCNERPNIERANENLPDRVTNPERYNQLIETSQEHCPQMLSVSTSTSSTAYGSIH